MAAQINQEAPYRWFLLFQYDRAKEAFLQPTLYEESRYLDRSEAVRCKYPAEMLGFLECIKKVTKDFFSNPVIQRQAKNFIASATTENPVFLVEFNGEIIQCLTAKRRRIPLHKLESGSNT